MSVLKLQTLEPEISATNAAAVSLTSSSSDCCKKQPN
ncbi:MULTISPECIES: class III lanthipeptide [Streptomyces]|uniref:Class III lanthipeptide n=1 Tax=Streptomyces broussonetiae TaxID=2686304 RepID=A0ABV5E2T6_9ACTN|nr:class III lanthipeptide [Streptomyces sp. B93]MBQ1091343.1 class III lanthipeptide [Streptomyces sp. B93]